MDYFFRFFYSSSRGYYHFNHFTCPVVECDFSTDLFSGNCSPSQNPSRWSQIEVKRDKGPQTEFHFEISAEEDDDEGKLPFECNICNQRFESKPRYNAHKREHFPQKQFVCILCKQIFNKKRDYLDHINQRGEEWPWRCDYR